jgi:hypothetical protein
MWKKNPLWPAQTKGFRIWETRTVELAPVWPQPYQPVAWTFYPNFSTVCVEGGGLPNSSLTGPVQSPGRATPTTRRLKQTSVPVTPRLVVWYRGLVGGGCYCLGVDLFFRIKICCSSHFKKVIISSTTKMTKISSRVYCGAWEAKIFILFGSTYLMTKVSMSTRSGNKNRLRCTVGYVNFFHVDVYLETTV